MMQEDFFIPGFIVSVEEVMQYLTSRVSNPALRQGLFFGIILSVILIGFSFISNFLGILGTLIVFALYLAFHFLAGQRASQSQRVLITEVRPASLTGVLTCITISIAPIIFVSCIFVTFLGSI